MIKRFRYSLLKLLRRQDENKSTWDAWKSQEVVLYGEDSKTLYLSNW